jgi:hypothetical protein
MNQKSLKIRLVFEAPAPAGARLDLAGLVQMRSIMVGFSQRRLSQLQLGSAGAKAVEPA